MTRSTRFGALLALFLACPVSPVSLAAEEAPRPLSSALTREVRNSLGGSFNPLGLQDVLDVSWRRSLSGSTNPMLSEAHVAFGFSQRLTPGYGRVGAWLEIAPLSVLDIRAGLEPVLYFGTFTALLRFPDYSASFDSDTLRERRGEAAMGLAGRAYLAPTLKAKVGSVIVRARAEFEWWRARDTGGFFYEPGRDTLLRASGDSMMTSEAMLLHQISYGVGKRLLLGPVYDMTWVYDAPENRKQDVGLVGIWQLGRRSLGLREPIVFVKVFYYLEDPFKKHEMGAQLAVGFAIGRPRGSK